MHSKLWADDAKGLVCVCVCVCVCRQRMCMAALFSTTWERESPWSSLVLWWVTHHALCLSQGFVAGRIGSFCCFQLWNSSDSQSIIWQEIKRFHMGVNPWLPVLPPEPSRSAGPWLPVLPPEPSRSAGPWLPVLPLNTIGVLARDCWCCPLNPYRGVCVCVCCR